MNWLVAKGDGTRISSILALVEAYLEIAFTAGARVRTRVDARHAQKLLISDSNAA